MWLYSYAKKNYVFRCVNFKSILDKVFVSKELAIVLLILHLTTFMAFTDYWWLKWVVTTHVRCNEWSNIYTHLNSPIFTQWFSFSSISCHIFCTTSCTTPVCGYIYERHPQMGVRCSPNSLSPLVYLHSCSWSSSSSSSLPSPLPHLSLHKLNPCHMYILRWPNCCRGLVMCEFAHLSLHKLNPCHMYIEVTKLLTRAYQVWICQSYNQFWRELS